MLHRTPESLTCPATGQFCTGRIPVFDRTITLRRWTGGSVKATVCSLACAEAWADKRGYVATGTSETHGKGASRIVVLVQHPDQLHNSINPRNKS